MKLALSSAAAPDASLAELASAARRRGLKALELVQGDAHGLLPPAPQWGLARAAAVLQEQQIEIAALVFLDLAAAEEWGARGDGAGTAVIVPGLQAIAFPDRLSRMRARGVSPVLAFSEPAHLLEVASLLETEDVGCAWEVRPQHGELARAAPAVVQAVGARLRHVRLHGGGPEAVAQEGLGVGDLMRELALASYGGSIALAPSEYRYRVIWSSWLGRRGGWGCGSKSREHTSLSTTNQESR